MSGDPAILRAACEAFNGRHRPGDQVRVFARLPLRREREAAKHAGPSARRVIAAPGAHVRDGVVVVALFGAVGLAVEDVVIGRVKWNDE
ncbi:MAG: hypothetical protein HY834_09005 [Devosia nanyangense]|uniref:Uncharacterized protein n=1 Tax=Devosia nanyangense TaxID=1228055 RepID=A0A933NY42_9HYPH|nr:hypothetical protein [Devosia nanyangense]